MQRPSSAGTTSSLALCTTSSGSRRPDDARRGSAEFAMLKSDERIMLHEDNEHEFMKVSLEKLKQRLPPPR